MKKKVVSVLLAAAMTTTLVAGCGSTGAADTAADTSAEAAEDTEATDTADTTKAATGDTIKVAVVKQMDHASLDEIANAVEEELDAIAAKNGVTIEYETYSGQGDQSVLNQIGTQVVSEDVDVIIPIATLAAQVMANCAEETQTPVVYAAISDPDAAELTGIDYVTGTSDALNTDFIMDMMFKQNPDVQKVGLLYSLSEANSTKPIADAKAYLDEKGIAYDYCPGVSAFCGAASALNLEYTLPEVSQSVIITRMEGRTPVPSKESIQSFAAHQATMVVFLSTGMLEELSRRLIEGGYTADTPAAIVYKATWPDEKSFICTVGTLAQTAAENNITKTALMIIGDSVKAGSYDRSKLYDPGFTTEFREATK